MQALTEARFRFDADQHRYTDLETGEVLPSITQMLDRTGWVEGEAWFTEASARRGSAVHALTAQYDLGALDVPSVVSPYRGYLLAHVAAMRAIGPTFDEIEEPHVHPRLRFGGRPDRVGTLYGLRGVLEIKTAAPSKSHRVQTALQAVLVSPTVGLPPHAIARFCLYLRDAGLQGTGRGTYRAKAPTFRLEECTDRRDFDAAYAVIRKCCGTC